jgi:hypothetical protein
MEKKSHDFSVKEAQRLAQTPEGQKLMALLQQQDNAALQKAMTEASVGNYQAAGAILQSLLSSQEAKSLMRQLGGKHG